jgi:D-alanyl-D-alanine dipeptidase
MKATLEFNLDEPHDRMAHTRCVKATDMALALWEITRIRRQMEKEDIDESLYTPEEMDRRMWDVIEQNGINLGELIE